MLRDVKMADGKLYIDCALVCPWRQRLPSVHSITCPPRVLVRVLCPLLIFLPLFFRSPLAEQGTVHLRVELELLGGRELVLRSRSKCTSVCCFGA